MKKQLKSSIMSAVLAGALLSPMGVSAAGNTMGAWTSGISGTVGVGVSMFLTDFFLQMGANVDPLQLAAEGALLAALKQSTVQWEGVEKDQRFVNAAEDNEDGACTTTTLDTITVSPEANNAVVYDIEVLTDVGLESVGLQGLGAVLSGRDQVAQTLTELLPANGSLTCNKSLTTNQIEALYVARAKNYEWLSTAGLTRGELALESIGATYEKDGVYAKQTDNGDGDIIAANTAEEENMTIFKLYQYPEKITSTASGMRVQAVMNLEFAQRLNLGNTLVGNELTILAARALNKPVSCVADPMVVTENTTVQTEEKEYTCTVETDEELEACMDSLGLGANDRDRIVQAHAAGEDVEAVIQEILDSAGRLKAVGAAI